MKRHERTAFPSSVASKAMRVTFDGGRLTSDANTLVLAEIDRRLGITERSWRTASRWERANHASVPSATQGCDPGRSELSGAPARGVRDDAAFPIGAGPSGTGMQETAQITTALRYLPWGRHVALITDGRFSGLSTGACIGHVGPEALDEGPIGRVRDDDVIEIVIDRVALTGSVNLVGPMGRTLDADECAALLQSRPQHPGLAPHPKLPADSRLWAALQRASGGTWGGCVYDVDRIVETLAAGQKSLGK